MEDIQITETPKSGSKFATGIKYGIIAGIVYILLILIRYLFLDYNPMIFTGAMLISYIIIIVFFIMAAIERKKELGGYADLKDLFAPVFIVILFAEVCYAVFNYIYLNFIDPDFFNHFMQTTMEYVKKMGGSTDAISKQMDKMEAQNAEKMSVLHALMGLGMWIIIDSVIGILIALIIRKPRPAQF